MSYGMFWISKTGLLEDFLSYVKIWGGTWFSGHVPKIQRQPFVGVLFGYKLLFS